MQATTFVYALSTVKNPRRGHHRHDTRSDMGDRHLVSTGVRWCRCGCGTFIGIALAEGFPVAVEPQKVDPITELVGLFAGRYSFDLIRTAHRTELRHRDYSRMKQRGYPVVLSHECNKVPPVEDPAELWKKRKPAATREPSPPLREPPPAPPF